VGEADPQRAAAGLAVGVLISTPSISVAFWYGKTCERLAMWCSSTPASVMILNVLPGGCGADCAMPASASTSPVPGWIAAMPP